MIYTTHSDIETQQLAEKFAQQFRESGGIIALQGELGAGKTTFVKGLAKGLRIQNRILSPTFVIIRQYQLPNQERLLVHSDLYRLNDHLSLVDAGLSDYFQSTQNIIVIEWPEKLTDLPKHLLITLKRLSENDRIISIDDGNKQ